MKNGMDKMKNMLAMEYVRFPMADVRTVVFARPAGELPLSYDTTRAAFLFPTQGRCRVSFDGDSFWAEPGKVIHGCPGRRITFAVEGTETFCHTNVYYTPYGGPRTGTDFMHEAFELPLGDPGGVETCLQGLLERAGRRDPHNSFQINALIQQLLDTLFCSENDPWVARESQFANAVSGYLNTHYAEPITLPELAARFGRTPAQLAYQFRKVTGQGPIAYLIQYRMDIAHRLLRENGYTVKQAAAAVGYQDEFYFSRLFKRHIGTAPSGHMSRRGGR